MAESEGSGRVGSRLERSCTFLLFCHPTFWSLRETRERAGQGKDTTFICLTSGNVVGPQEWESSLLSSVLADTSQGHLAQNLCF